MKYYRKTTKNYFYLDTVGLKEDNFVLLTQFDSIYFYKNKKPHNAKHFAIHFNKKQMYFYNGRHITERVFDKKSWRQYIKFLIFK